MPYVWYDGRVVCLLCLSTTYIVSWASYIITRGLWSAGLYLIRRFQEWCRQSSGYGTILVSTAAQEAMSEGSSRRFLHGKTYIHSVVNFVCVENPCGGLFFWKPSTCSKKAGDQRAALCQAVAISHFKGQMRCFAGAQSLGTDCSFYFIIWLATWSPLVQLPLLACVEKQRFTEHPTLQEQSIRKDFSLGSGSWL